MVKIEAKRVVDLAADRLRTEILDGTWPPGTHLPAERELALQLGPSRPTIRAAILRLESEGLLKARHGSGVEVLDWRTTGDVGLLPTLLEGGGSALVEPFLSLRRAVAAEAIARATVRASDEDLAALSALAEELAGERDLERLAEGNLRFSRRVVELADNLPMQLLFNTVARVLTARPDLRRRLLHDVDGVRRSFPAIVWVLRSRDPEQARTVVLGVLEALDRAVVASFSEDAWVG